MDTVAFPDDNFDLTKKACMEGIWPGKVPVPARANGMAVYWPESVFVESAGVFPFAVQSFSVPVLYR